MGFTNITVLGTGVLGSQIAMQAAYHGKTVTSYDVSHDCLDKLPARWDWMRARYARDLADFDSDRFDRAIAAIRTSVDLADAVADADLVIEAVPENLDVKRSVWGAVGDVAPAHTVFATNTSTLRLSDVADATGRPERFLALHFANLVWKHNTGEVMRTPRTSDDVFDAVLDFSVEIGLEPVALQKETPGYIINSLLVPFLFAAARLYVDGVANPAEIDKTWRISSGAPDGPFQVFDIIGFNVIVHLLRAHPDDAQLQRFADLLEEQGTRRSRAGVSDGAGFYTYDAEGRIGAPVQEWNLPA